MFKRLRIALLIESSRAHGRDMLHGIAAFARAHGPWSMYLSERLISTAAPPRLKHWKPDGIIARIESRQLLDQIRAMRVPVVDLCGICESRDIPVVATNHRVAAQFAADHLMECGLEHFGFCGFSGLAYSDERCKHFVQHLAEARRKTSVYVDLHPPRMSRTSAVEAKYLLRNESLRAWVKSLPKPVGVMACNDMRAQQVLDACGECGIAVPDEVAVIGVDNDNVLCELSSPPLSSVDLNGQQAGYIAAATLDKMIRKGGVPDKITLIEPLGVVVRRSTDVLAITDDDVAAAVRLVRDRACSGLRVRDIVATLAISPSTLERHFAKHLGRSPKAEILRIRIREAQYLLAKTNLSLIEIAQRTGFNRVEGLCSLFKEKMGLTPGQYRRESRVAGAQ